MASENEKIAKRSGKFQRLSEKPAKVNGTEMISDLATAGFCAIGGGLACAAIGFCIPEFLGGPSISRGIHFSLITVPSLLLLAILTVGGLSLLLLDLAITFSPTK